MLKRYVMYLDHHLQYYNVPSQQKEDANVLERLMRGSNALLKHISKSTENREPVGKVAKQS